MVFYRISKRFQRLYAERELFAHWDAQQKFKAEEDSKRIVTQELHIQDILDQQATKVTLNVGGVIFETSIQTLTKVKTSMLAAMFSGRYANKETVRPALLYPSHCF